MNNRTKQTSSYEAGYTISRTEHRLSAERPVQVWTYLADTPQHKKNAPAGCCGKIRPIPRNHTGSPHDHDHYEIAFILSGSAIYETAAGRTRIGPGSVQAIAPGEVHAYYEMKDICIVECAYLGEWLMVDTREFLAEGDLAPLFLHANIFEQNQRPGLPEWTVSESVSRKCFIEMRDIANECATPHPSPTYLKACLKKLMFILSRSRMKNQQLAIPTVDRRIRIALEKIEGIVLQSQPFDVALLAAELGVSTGYFTRLFRQSTGRSPMNYYQHRRVQEACRLLLDQRHTITEIAYMLGYADGAHFDRFFKTHRGTTPRAYRRRYSSVE